MSSNVIAFPARKPLRKIVLDTETSGLYPEDGHRIVELAAIEIRDGGCPTNLLHQFFNPGREVDEDAAEVHGMTWEELKDEPSFADHANQIAEFLRDAELIIHNAPFDVGFLNAEFQRVGLPPVEEICVRVTDTLAMAKKLHPGKSNNLDALCEKYEVDTSQMITHGAMLDAEILSEIYRKMIYRGKAR